MKHLILAAFLGGMLLAGHAAAQTPAPNAGVTSAFSNEIVTATDGDDTCVFIGPFRVLAGLPPSDNITVQCYVATAPRLPPTLRFTANISVAGLTSVSSSFSSNAHIIGWTITKVAPGNFTWDISLDGIHHVGVF